ncbi:MAG: hypothetical protein E6Q37_08890 [Crocinitomicaceae bacterium]|nr:MAG: hypothetical protein E6Q37_08890 [Crocinitomicaceae bacterium]
MKGVFIGLFKYHVVPVLIAVVLTIATFFAYKALKPTSSAFKTEIIAGNQEASRNYFSNCVAGNQSELELAGALKNPQTITLFGSSEIGEMRYSPYFFLPDSLGIPTVAFGHAFQQHFSMFCELLAMQKELNGSKICIIISPSWFETEGTNIEAFLEFVRPNFLKSIVHNPSIPMQYKQEIGRYVSEHYKDIEHPAAFLTYFKKLHQFKNVPVLNTEMENSKRGITRVVYDVKTKPVVLPKKQSFDWDERSKVLQKQFVDSIRSNQIYVNDAYYLEYLFKDKHYKKGSIDPIPDATDCREFQDFLLLVDVLKRYNCDASFVIQPLHPYHYEGLDKLAPIVEDVTKVLQKNNFPYLNLFVTDPHKYEPGTLNDIMHLGDYGWMQINRFLYTNYARK